MTLEQYTEHQARLARAQFGQAHPRTRARSAAELARLSVAPPVSVASAPRVPVVKVKRRISDAAAKVVMVDLCRRAHMPVPVAEYRFHHARLWRFDYAWPDYLLALELEGGIWQKGGGGHSHPMHIERDIEKYSEAAVLGWSILRVQPADLVVIGFDLVERALRRRDERRREGRP